jgi:UDP-glucose 4-epimerase
MKGTYRNVLVTGGAGFVGSHLVPLLLKEGYSVTVLDNLSTGKLENLEGALGHSKFKFLRSDISDSCISKEVFDGIDSVIHLAALIDISASIDDPVQNNEVNANGTFNMLNLSTKYKVKKFVFASSTAIYGDAKKLPISEETSPKPISPYAASKVAGEAYCSAFASCFGIETVVLRFFNVYGLRSQNSSYSGVITKFIEKILKEEPLVIDGDGNQTRDFINVSDVSDAIILALEREDVKGEVFNVCSGEATSVNQLVAILKKIIGQNVSVLHGPARLGDISDNYGNPSKALKGLGFKASVNLSDGLKLLINEF